jgi:hypothetical protein
MFIVSVIFDDVLAVELLGAYLALIHLLAFLVFNDLTHLFRQGDLV